MDKSVRLSARQQQVLRATVRYYVATAEPVGSKALLNAYDLQVSSATVRNVMGALERSGLLYQPHTSAGRVPSDSGYRIYVDELMEPSKPLAREVDATFSRRLNWDNWGLEVLLREATQILAHLSGYIALVTLPTASAAKLRHVQLVQIDPTQILLVVLLDSHSTESILIPLPLGSGQTASSREALDRELQILSNFLTAQLMGKPLAAMAALNLNELDQAFERYSETLSLAMLDLARRTQAPQTQILMSGLAEALGQPEFAERSQMRELIALLEDGQDQLWPLIFEQDDAGRPRIWIGAENPLQPMHTCALISSVYSKDAVPVGSVGVLGPTRMIYENAVAAVEAAADYITDALTQSAA
jgi:heat-inducible transcriptional repressor